MTLAKANPRTRDIKHFFKHTGFPVDIRHNAKITREKQSKPNGPRLNLGKNNP
jgi:hypothetical protein